MVNAKLLQLLDQLKFFYFFLFLYLNLPAVDRTILDVCCKAVVLNHLTSKKVLCLVKVQMESKKSRALLFYQSCHDLLSCTYIYRSMAAFSEAKGSPKTK